MNDKFEMFKIFIFVELLLIIQGVFLHSWSELYLPFYLIFHIPLSLGVGFLIAMILNELERIKND